jgi:hypothetical protein
MSVEVTVVFRAPELTDEDLEALERWIEDRFEDGVFIEIEVEEV